MNKNKPITFRLEQAKELDLPEPESFGEMGQRLIRMEKLQHAKVGRPSDLRQRVEHLEARVLENEENIETMIEILDTLSSGMEQIAKNIHLFLEEERKKQNNG